MMLMLNPNYVPGDITESEFDAPPAEEKTEEEDKKK